LQGSLLGCRLLGQVDAGFGQKKGATFSLDAKSGSVL